MCPVLVLKFIFETEYWREIKWFQTFITSSILALILATNDINTMQCIVYKMIYSKTKIIYRENLNTDSQMKHKTTTNDNMKPRMNSK